MLHLASSFAGALAACSIAGLALASSVARAAVLIETLIESGDAAPGAGTFTGFGVAAIDDEGTVAFHGFALPQGTGLWRMSDTAIERLATVGEVLPGAPGGETLAWIDHILMPRSGDAVVFRTRLLSSDEAYYAAAPGPLAPIAIEGQPAPGTGAAFQRLNPSLRMSDDGEIAFWALLDGGGVDDRTGIWSGGAGTLQLVARQGSNAPGGGGDDWFIIDQYPRIAPDGTVAFAAVLFGLSGRAGVWTGTPVPSGPAVLADLADYRSASISDDDRLGFLEFLSQSGDPARLRVGRPGNFRTVIEDGAQGPGLPPGISISAAWPILEARVNRSGDAAFRTQTQETTRRSGLWSDAGGGPTLLALEGEPAPGLPGFAFGEIEGFELNDLGQTAFLARLEGPLDRGLFLADPGEAPQLVARGQGFFRVGPGDSREVASLNVGLESEIFSNESERGGLSNRGELVFSLAFQDGSSGIFVATLPEPRSAALRLAALVSVAWLLRPLGRSSRIVRMSRRARAGTP